MNKTTITENLNNQIRVLKRKIKSIQDKSQKETNQAVIAAYEVEVETLTSELSEYQDELDTLLNAEKYTTKDELLNFVKDTDIAYLADEGKYVSTTNQSTSLKMINLQEKIIDQTRIVGVLNVLTKSPKKYDLLKPCEIRGVFESAKKSYIGRTSSFSSEKWDESRVYNSLTIQRKYWCQLSTETHSELFDHLMYSVAGGKQENIDHLEQWIAYKYLYPERCVTTPNLEIVGQPGGNGKGILRNAIESVFIPKNVGSVTVKGMIGGFNLLEEGKVVIVVDDPPQNTDISDHFKERAGNKDGIIERKGIDAYEIDNTSNWLMTLNQFLIKQYGGGRGGEDRRLSVIFTNIKLITHLMDAYGITESESAELASVMNDFAMDRREVGKWLNHIIEKHDVRNMHVLLALHGQDYHDRLEDQKDQYTEIFEELLPAFIKNQNIPHKFLKGIVSGRLHNPIKNTKTLIKKFNEFLHREGYDIETTSTKTNIFVKGKKVGVLSDRVKRIKGSTCNFNFDDVSIGEFNEHNEIEPHEIRLYNPDADMSKLDEVRDRLNRGASVH